MMRLTVPLIGCAAVCALTLGFFLVSHRAAPYPEAATMSVGVEGFTQLSNRFQSLAQEKGALYAYEVLRRVQLPPDTDVHLLGHTVGDELYKQKGVSGIADCTQEFRNACSHTIAIGALNEFGSEKALSLIHEACKSAPGGSGAYTMCHHGLGHGVFAYYGYDLTKTHAFCKKTGTAGYHNREYVECMGGAIMELMGGGGHDRDAWLVSREKYLDAEDPLAPCSTAVIPREAKGICYTYITPRLFEAAGGDLAAPQPRDFAIAFTFCDKISKSAPDLRRDCFSGIGKEFPVLALSRDIRSLDMADDAALRQMREWCALAPHEEAYQDCTRSIVSSLYWGGESDPHTVVRFCDLATGDERGRCFTGIFEEARQYSSLQYPNAGVCTLVPSDTQSSCQTALSS